MRSIRTPSASLGNGANPPFCVTRMGSADSDIVVEDPQAPADASPSVTSARTVEVVVYVLLVALALLLGFDNWRSGAGWAKDGPQSGYLPFYLCVILACASLPPASRCCASVSMSESSSVAGTSAESMPMRSASAASNTSAVRK